MDYFDILTKILLAVLFGGILGAERARAGKPAGLRTYMLVTLAVTVFTIISQDTPQLQSANYDPGRIISQVILGIGFLGGGIIFKKGRVTGLTTAAGLWIATAIGITVGLGLYLLGAIVTVVSFIILAILPVVEDKINTE